MRASCAAACSCRAVDNASDATKTRITAKRGMILPLMFAPIVIVGAGQAAAQAAETIRRRGHVGPLVVIGDEALLPYQRPPLSKKYLAGQMEADRLLIRHADHYHEHGIDLHLGFPVVSLVPSTHRLEVADGSHFEYERLLLATGSRPRLLPVPGAELLCVDYART